MTLLFSASLFLSAALLFWLELLFARLALPLLGGSPAVWNTCTAFYQASLLAGYYYADACARLGTRRSKVAHLALLTLSMACLPIALSAHFLPKPGEPPASALLALALASIGAPLFMISASSPLLQVWFGAKDPYFLFQASNFGSLAALLSYPLLIEPHLKLGEQAKLLSAGYILLAAALVSCAALSARHPERRLAPETRLKPAPLRQRIHWALLAFVPSSLMLAVTTYLSAYISPMPLLWAIPLAIYLLSFIATFGRKPWVPLPLIERAQPILLLPVALVMMTDTFGPAGIVLPLHLALLAATAILCHGQLAAHRPPVSQLTQFYLWLAIGGALAGAFNAFIGPALFRSVMEYPATLVLACLLRPAQQAFWRWRWTDLALPILLGLAAGALPWTLHALGLAGDTLSLKPLLCIPVILCFLFKERPLRLSLGVAALFAGSLSYAAESGRLLHIERSFFGVHRVLIDPQKRCHWLSHGNVVHGGQEIDPARAKEPLAYYTRSGPLGEMFGALAIAKANAPVAVIGLGTGGMACYGAALQSWTFYEIDPAVFAIARNTRYFTFLRDCPPKTAVVLGDARLSLLQAPANSYAWLIVDAFSSDAIPMHLLTQQAFTLYLSRLRPGGYLAFHISNHFLDLEPALGSLAREANLAALIKNDPDADPDGPGARKFASDWVVMTRAEPDLKNLRHNPGWRKLKEASGPVWSDDYSNLRSAIRWH